MDCSPPSSPVPGISQARILEWVASPGDLPNPGINLGLRHWQADCATESPGKPFSQSGPSLPLPIIINPSSLPFLSTPLCFLHPFVHTVSSALMSFPHHYLLKPHSSFKSWTKRTPLHLPRVPTLFAFLLLSSIRTHLLLLCDPTPACDPLRLGDRTTPSAYCGQ